ncbi:hypothetical protein CHGG_10249 [Chaetomium globosum CBS 148.51]|uniref:Uncharacterized protein n=1 Tax=Chaetomium globosum (strain ATCC 6205 / CBS 148.51 / DSM 1962 / NBRC 6347 / NRRL 1970) TaxID=306901 RepID=Q2GP55_CHAGB|nr:uncharacterized protein CHGG_10249 [Chaetomium globosum CBS 148.51]EAQ83845.1 hypothetical protein CHGG_10249 [Chaetomium globosum CBS 148.51]
MKKPAGNAAGSVPAASAATTRNLRPRQASGAPEPPAGGRVTRSSAALPSTASTNENPAVPQPPPPSTPTKSHKRPGSPAAIASRPKRTRHSPHKPGFYGEDSDSDSGDEVENPPNPDVEQKASTRQRRQASQVFRPVKWTTSARTTKNQCQAVPINYPAPEKGKDRKWKNFGIDVEQIASKTFRGQLLDLKSLVNKLTSFEADSGSFTRKTTPLTRSLGMVAYVGHYPSRPFLRLSTDRKSQQRERQMTSPTRLIGWQWESAADGGRLVARDGAFIQSMADAITALPNLKHLTIESSTAANDQLLRLLPKELETLGLINCWDVDGDDFTAYLLTNGHQLKRLILHHNQSLGLSFLPVLGAACPNLQVLSMDFKTFQHHEFYRDSDPSYDQLLTTDQVPEWPEALEALQLLNMKKWSADAAETLFQSLADSSSKLLKLRHLELKAMLSIPILERSRLRNKWERKLRYIFLRENQDPVPLFSLRNPAQPPDRQEVKRASKKPSKSTRALPAGYPSRRSDRLKRSNSPSPSSSIGAARSLRNGLGRPSYAEPDTDEDEDEEEGDEAEGGQGVDESVSSSQPESPASSAGNEVPFRQGMCEKVEIQLDNQKSVETTLTMDDFLDSENNDLSDDDWVGQDDDEDTGYAW